MAAKYWFGRLNEQLFQVVQFWRKGKSPYFCLQQNATLF
jgi:hypothetical protein